MCVKPAAWSCKFRRLVPAGQARGIPAVSLSSAVEKTWGRNSLTVILWPDRLLTEGMAVKVQSLLRVTQVGSTPNCAAHPLKLRYLHLPTKPGSCDTCSTPWISKPEENLLYLQNRCTFKLLKNLAISI